MAAITAADVTYTLVSQRLAGVGRTVRQIKLTFPNNATNTAYPTGGIPLSALKLGGARGSIASLAVLGRTTQAAATNVRWEWDGSQTAPKLLGYEIAADTAGDAQGIELDNSDTLAENGAVIFVEATV